MDAGTAYVVHLPGFLLPRTFSVTWDDGKAPVVSMDVIVDQQGRPHCKQVTVRGQWEQDVSGTDFRDLRVNAFLDDAVAYAVMREDKPGRLQLFKSAEDFRAFREKYRRSRPQARWRLTSDHLKEVARIYHAAGGAKGRGVLAVAEAFDTPRGTVNHWVEKAKLEGYVDEIEKSTTKTRRGGR
jgi:hypothetical protein